MLAIKQTAWLLRNTAGEASLIISKGLAAGRITPEIRQNFTKFTGGTATAWNALELCNGRHAIAAGAVRRDGRDQDRPISIRNISRFAIAW